ncbi:unnamed protein product, partial [Phaeothamnion confervicola]
GESISGIFGGFETAPKRQTAKPAGGDIFRGFDTVSQHQAAKPVAQPAENIFGDLNAAPQRQLVRPAGGDIFDGFETAPQRQTTKTAAAQPAKDIFGDFDVAPQKLRRAKGGAAEAAASAVAPEIFASFGTAPQRPATPATKPAVQESAGDVLGGFEAAPQRLRPAAAPPAPVEDIFAAFDVVPPPPRRENPQALAEAVDPLFSGQLRGDPFGEWDAGPSTPAARAAASPATTVSVVAAQLSPARSVGSTSSAASRYGYGVGEEPDWAAYDQLAEWSSSDSDGDDDAPAAPAYQPTPERQLWPTLRGEMAYCVAAARLLREMSSLLGGLDDAELPACDFAAALASVGAGAEAAHDAPTCGALRRPSTRTAALATGFTTPPLAVATAVTLPPQLECVRQAANALCRTSGLHWHSLLAAAASLSCAGSGSTRRLALRCLLLRLLGRPTAIDAAVCSAARRVLQLCSIHAGDGPKQSVHDAGASNGAAAATTTSASGAAVGGDGGGGGGSDAWQGRTRGSAPQIRAVAFQLELCLALHSRGCLRLSARAQVEAAMASRVAVLLAAWHHRYDIVEAIVANPPEQPTMNALAFAGMEMEQPQLGDGGNFIATGGGVGGGDGSSGDGSGGSGRPMVLVSPNTALLEALS